MTIKYDSKRESLAEIIKKATIQATYVVPDFVKTKNVELVCGTNPRCTRNLFS